MQIRRSGKAECIEYQLSVHQRKTHFFQFGLERCKSKSIFKSNIAYNLQWFEDAVESQRTRSVKSVGFLCMLSAWFWLTGLAPVVRSLVQCTFGGRSNASRSVFNGGRIFISFSEYQYQRCNFSASETAPVIITLHITIVFWNWERVASKEGQRTQCGV